MPKIKDSKHTVAIPHQLMFKIRNEITRRKNQGENASIRGIILETLEEKFKDKKK